jgi:DNA-binding transcriptional LysR family regulator
VVVGTSGFEEHILPPLLVRLKELYPDVNVLIRPLSHQDNSMILRHVREGDIHIAFCAYLSELEIASSRSVPRRANCDDPAAPALQITTWYASRLRLAIGTPHLEKVLSGICAHAPVTIVAAANSRHSGRLVSEWSAEGIDATLIEIGSLPAVREAALVGLGAGLLFDGMIEADVQTGRLSILPSPADSYTYTVHIVRLSQLHGPAADVAAFLEGAGNGEPVSPH